jgi:hypothetical protein
VPNNNLLKLKKYLTFSIKNRNYEFRLWSNDSYSGLIFNLLNRIGKTIEVGETVFVEEGVKVINVTSQRIVAQTKILLSAH